jgi:NAD(P)-dependent dehydrogenase (short-subunit alcohol dehydrogenase family)
MILAGRNAIVTGANQGLGLEIARAFVAEGANVMICARDSSRLHEAAEELRSKARPGQQVIAETANVSDEDDVRRIVGATINAFDQIHILVSNAGVYGPKGRIEDVDWTEWTRAMEINVYGSVLFYRHVVPHMRAKRYGKIIQLSGGGATTPLPGISAYAASKAAIVRFAETLAEETRGSGIDVNSIAPGPLNTRLLDEVLEAGPEKVGREFYEKSVRQKNEGGAPLARGAELSVFLASAASDGITGKLLSAIWDPWETLSDRREDLRGDVYTLRRIVPKDRGFGWGDR